MLTPDQIAALSREWDRINAELARLPSAPHGERRAALLERLDEIEYALGEHDLSQAPAIRAGRPTSPRL